MSASAIRAGAAYIELMLRDKVTAGLKSASKTLNTFGKDVTTVGTRLMGLGAAITAPLIAASTAFATTAGDLDDMSQRTGMSTEGLSELGYAATMTGATTEDLEKSIRKMNVSLADAAGGSETANAALAAIGLTTQQLAGMSPDEQFEAIAIAIGGVADPAKRAGLAMDIFGKSGAMLVPLMNEGAEGMAKLRQEARDLGLSMSGEDAKAAATFGEALNRLTSGLLGLRNAVGAALLPVLADQAEWLKKIVVDAIAWAKANKELIVTVLKVGAGLAVAGAAIVAIGAAITGLGSVFGVLATVSGMVASAVGMIGTVLAALLSPIGLVIAGATAIGAGILHATGAGGAALQWLSEVFGVLKDDALAAWGGIAEALMAGDLAKAGEIAWLALKLVWQQGINEINGLWLTATNFIQSTWIDAWAMIESTFTDVFAYFSSYLNDFLSEFQKGWGDATDWLANRLLDLWGMFDETLDVAAAQGIVNESGADRNKGIDERRDEWNRDPEGMRQKRQKEIEAQRVASQGQLQTDFQNGLLAGDAKVNADREALQASIAQAKEPAPKPDGKPMPELDLPYLDESLSKEADKLESKGTFNAFAARGLGADSLGERTARATENVAENTRRLLAKADRAQLVFGA